ncbi:hypothetical protein [Actinomadura chibensis]|uniref:DUF2812 domain-containing protein n=1 Tax=Actinomadura chibensis TaxID=392828 RepID=A0A5D0NP75_9ACTN|nr:hypothetical protein [Actinomadura chibensis]TYB46192.1 hypothetical protein FXF69_12985 [Actinomadura chibensis]
MTNPYFEELAQRLRDRGLPADQVTLTVDDLAAYVAESGTDPVQEFGAPEEFALQVAPSRQREDAAPPSSAETWTWRADAFHERDVLNHYGDEGWEVERVDAAGRFVSHREPDNPQRWEYRRETVMPGRRQALADRLAPDGWEPCGTWICFEYFKRPKAATIGPEAELRDVPETPARRTFFSKRFIRFITAYAFLVAAICATGLSLTSGDSQGGFLTGIAVGALLMLAVLVTWLYTDHRRNST